MTYTCKLCFKLFSSPRLLPCLHVFDSQCISKYVASDVIRCPECKSEIIVKENFANLPIYWPVIESILRRAVDKEFELACSVCIAGTHLSLEPATAVCVDCDGYLCAELLDRHLELNESGTFRGHRFLSIAEVLSAPQQSAGVGGATSGPACKRHPGCTVTHYCVPCKALLCEKMEETDVTAHEGHARQRAIALPHATHEEWLQVHSELAQLSERCTQLKKLSIANEKLLKNDFKKLIERQYEVFRSNLEFHKESVLRKFDNICKFQGSKFDSSLSNRIEEMKVMESFFEKLSRVTADRPDTSKCSETARHRIASLLKPVSTCESGLLQSFDEVIECVNRFDSAGEFDITKDLEVLNRMCSFSLGIEFSFSLSDYKAMLEKTFNFSCINENVKSTNSKSTSVPLSPEAKALNSREALIRPLAPLSTDKTSIARSTASRSFSSVAVLKPVPHPQSSSASSASPLTTLSVVPLLRSPPAHLPTASALSFVQPTSVNSKGNSACSVRSIEQSEDIVVLQASAAGGVSVSRVEPPSVRATPPVFASTCSATDKASDAAVASCPPPAKVARITQSSSVHVTASVASRAPSCELIEDSSPRESAAIRFDALSANSNSGANVPRKREHPTREELENALQLFFRRIKALHIVQDCSSSIVKYACRICGAATNCSNIETSTLGPQGTEPSLIVHILIYHVLSNYLNWPLFENIERLIVWVHFVGKCLWQADSQLLVISPSETSCSACAFKGSESEVLVHALASHLDPKYFASALLQRFIAIENKSCDFYTIEQQPSVKLHHSIPISVSSNGTYRSLRSRRFIQCISIPLQRFNQSQNRSQSPSQSQSDCRRTQSACRDHSARDGGRARAFSDAGDRVSWRRRPRKRAIRLKRISKEGAAAANAVEEAEDDDQSIANEASGKRVRPSEGNGMGTSTAAGPHTDSPKSRLICELFEMARAVIRNWRRWSNNGFFDCYGCRLCNKELGVDELEADIHIIEHFSNPEPIGSYLQLKEIYSLVPNIHHLSAALRSTRKNIVSVPMTKYRSMFKCTACNAFEHRQSSSVQLHLLHAHTDLIQIAGPGAQSNAIESSASISNASASSASTAFTSARTTAVHSVSDLELTYITPRRSIVTASKTRQSSRIAFPSKSPPPNSDLSAASVQRSYSSTASSSSSSSQSSSESSGEEYVPSHGSRPRRKEKRRSISASSCASSQCSSTSCSDSDCSCCSASSESSASSSEDEEESWAAATDSFRLPSNPTFSAASRQPNTTSTSAPSSFFSPISQSTMMSSGQPEHGPLGIRFRLPAVVPQLISIRPQTIGSLPPGPPPPGPPPPGPPPPGPPPPGPPLSGSPISGAWISFIL